MTSFFHVSEPKAVGTIIPPGRFSTISRRYITNSPWPAGSDLTNLVWEIALESARKASRPNAPSRMNCIFACETLGAARLFRQRYRPAHFEIYRAEAVVAGTPIHRGDFTAISSHIPNSPSVDYFSDAAARYWLAQPSDIIELIIGGPIRLIEGPL